MAEPSARWTHLEPDLRLKSFNIEYVGLPEMWLFHIDNVHFDLIIRKDSVLAKEGSIKQRLKQSEKSKAEGFANQMVNKDIEEKEKVEVEAAGDALSGPGYMGWEVKDASDDSLDGIDFKKKSKKHMME